MLFCRRCSEHNPCFTMVTGGITENVCVKSLAVNVTSLPFIHQHSLDLLTSTSGLKNRSRLHTSWIATSMKLWKTVHWILAVSCMTHDLQGPFKNKMLHVMLGTGGPWHLQTVNYWHPVSFKKAMWNLFWVLSFHWKILIGVTLWCFFLRCKFCEGKALASFYYSIHFTKFNTFSTKENNVY